MAELAVDALRESLKELWLYHANLIDNGKEQVEMIESHLHRIKAFLRDPTVRQRSHQELLRHIRDVVYEAEDIIDAYLMQVSERKSTNYFFRKALSKSINLHDVCQNLQSVSDQIATNSNNATNDDDLIHQRLHEITQPIWIRGNNVVSLEDEIEKVIEYLNEESKELDVVVIVGMPGIGKTALARTIFDRQDIMDEFPTRIWIHISNNFIEKDVFLAILKNFTQTDDDINHKSAKELAKLAAVYLEREKFLIVMDDVWSPHDWDRLRIALPESNKGRVLITSCNEKVGLHANRTRVPHKVRFLTQTESWSLLKSEVFGDQECPHELENIGRLIAEQCEGLPLAILTMASTLVEEELSSSDMRERRIAWTKAGFRVPQYRNNIFYHSLPYNLQCCFLYFGMFPYDFEIPVWKLIRLWIAEGFIQQNGSFISLEETAETYLDDLISRNLVTVCRIKSDGNLKTCRIHRMLHEFCKIEGGNGREDFLQEIKFSDGVFKPELSQLPNYRRLCIHSNVLGFLSSNPSGPRVRSFVSFCEEDAENNSAIPQAFKLLRVLDASHIRFTKISSAMCQLLHLRYLVLSITIHLLPSAFTTRLSKLKTLVVNTTSRTLDFKGDILDFTELRYLKTNASTTLARHGKSKTSINHVQQLGTISPDSCTKELLERACNMKKLGIRGPISAFFQGKSGSLDSLAKLENLEVLKLLNDVFPKSPSQGRVHSLPPASKFPPRLRSLTLASTYLDWSQMNILGSLERLTVLKLKDNAFVGRNWVTHDSGFDSLEALHIEHTDLVIWVASAQQFPRLRRLQLHYCEQLREVPFQLADTPSLQHLELFNSKLAAASARGIGEEIIKQRKNQEGPSENAKEFKLSVFPSE